MNNNYQPLKSSSSTSSFGSLFSSCYDDGKSSISSMSENDYGYYMNSNNTNNNNHNNNSNSNQLLISVTQFINAAIQNDVNMINMYHQTLNIPVDVVDKNGYTALIYASRNGNVNVVKRLIELNANVDYQEPLTFSTALHYAAQCGHTRTAEVLINFGHANRTIQNHCGKTPYELAKDFGHGNNKIMKSLFCINDDDNDDNKNIENNEINITPTTSTSSLASSSSSSLLKAKNMGSSSSIDSGLSHDNFFRSEIDLNNNNNSEIDEFVYKKCDQIESNNASHSNNNNNNNGKKKMIRKNVSYLPHSTILECFSKYGCYRLMGEGYGFALVAKNGPIHQMIYDSFINLEIPMNNFDELIIRLEKIIQELETNMKLTIKEYEEYDYYEYTNQQRINNLYTYNLWRKENNEKIMKMIQFLKQYKQI